MNSDAIEGVGNGVHIVSVAKAGHVNQCKALCTQLGWPVAKVVQIPGASRQSTLTERVKINWQRYKAARAAIPRQKESERLVLVASGVAAEQVAAAYRDIYGMNLFAVFVGSPKSKRPIFDVAIASRHADLPHEPGYVGARETVWITGVLVAPMNRSGASAALQAAFIGGENKAYRLDAGMLANQLREAVQLGNNAGLKTSIVFSRRTPDTLEQQLRNRFADNADFVGREDRQGFLQTLQGAQRFYVTPDSITMVCEARSTGQSVSLFELPCNNPDTSTARFVGQALESGLVSRLGAPATSGLQSNDGCAEAVERVGALHRQFVERTARALSTTP